MNEREFTRTLKITYKFETNFDEKVLKFLFNKNATVINPLIMVVKKGHTYVKKAAAKS